MKTVVKMEAVTKRKTIPAPDINKRSRIRELVEMIEESWFEFSILISDIYYDEMYKTWGYEEFADYVVGELNISYKVAILKVTMGKVIKSLGLKKDRIAKMGWTKFKELSLLLNEGMSAKQVDEYIEKAKEMSFRELQDFVKAERLKLEGRGEASRKITMVFRLFDEAASVVEEALKESMELIRVGNENAALEYICQEWLIKRTQKPIKNIMEKLHIKEEVKVRKKTPTDKEKRDRQKKSKEKK